MRNQILIIDSSVTYDCYSVVAQEVSSETGLQVECNRVDLSAFRIVLMQRGITLGGYNANSYLSLVIELTASPHDMSHGKAVNYVREMIWHAFHDDTCIDLDTVACIVASSKYRRHPSWSARDSLMRDITNLFPEIRCTYVDGEEVTLTEDVTPIVSP